MSPTYFDPVSKQARFGRWMTALVKAAGSTFDAAEIARARYKNTPEVEETIKAFGTQWVTKAAVTTGTTADGGGPITQNQLSRDVYGVLSSMLLGRILANLRRVSFFTPPMAESGSGASAEWIGEGLPMPLTKTTFDDSPVLKYFKAQCARVLTKEAFRFSPLSEEANGRVMPAALDRFLVGQLLDPGVSAGSANPASLTSQGTAVTTAGTSASNVLTDLEALIAAIETPLETAAWIMPRKTFGRIAAKLASLGLTVTPNNLLGFPALLGSSAPSGQITLIDGDAFVYASDDAVEIDLATQGTVEMKDGSLTQNATSGTGTTMVSLWQSGLIGVRASLGINYAPWVFQSGSPTQASGIAYCLVNY